jgi:hypothetical protein
LRFRFIQLAVAVVALSLALSCSRPGPSDSGKTAKSNRPSKHAGARDLAADEAQGGHTLKKHVGRSDNDLRERLRREPNISAASTYTDRHNAEDFVGECLAENQGRLIQWENADRHPNLVLDCIGDPAWPIGRSLRRGRSEVEPCSKATLVLKFEPPQDYYVLTSYPDCQ